MTETTVQPPEGGEPTAELLREVLQLGELLVAEERARGRGLEMKAATLAGFTGAILALTTTEGRELSQLDLGRIGDPIFHVAFIIAVVGLLSAALLYVGGVLRPQGHRTIRTTEFKQLIHSLPKMERPSQIQGALLSTLAGTAPTDEAASPGILETERALNDRKARLMRAAGVLLVFGLTGVGGQALVLALHEAGL